MLIWISGRHVQVAAVLEYRVHSLLIHLAIMVEGCLFCLVVNGRARVACSVAWRILYNKRGVVKCRLGYVPTRVTLATGREIFSVLRALLSAFE